MNRLAKVRAVVDSFPSQKSFAEAAGLDQPQVSKALSIKTTTAARLAPLESAIARKKLGDISEGKSKSGKPGLRIAEELTNFNKSTERNPARSVYPGEVPSVETHIFKGLSLTLMGQPGITVDLIVTGRPDRLEIPLSLDFNANVEAEDNDRT